MNYGEKLKEIRRKKELTQNAVADYLGISQVTYSHYEVQEKIIPLERLNDLSTFFNVSIDYLLGFSNNLNYSNHINGIDKKIVGERLKKFRKENKLTQVKLAEILNTVHPVITNYENGKNLIALSFLYDICKKYNISADYLLGKIDNPKYLK
ncbi:MAG: helix-turn-helix domain-containing protein [Ruminococcus sp.]|nr:helix-turn-helix domain-containing protein [Ruminococcus sp.]